VRKFLLSKKVTAGVKISQNITVISDIKEQLRQFITEKRLMPNNSCSDQISSPQEKKTVLGD
jgi:hypothetical protein